jgi:site-specific DNA recombinase
MTSFTAKRAVVYARVSTGRQAEADLSIPDQIRQAEQWCSQNGVQLVRQFIEPGASGTDENRPVFQEMLEAARRKPCDFDVIIIHSFSRFCRDSYTYYMACRILERAGITLHSLTQPLNPDPTGDLVRSILVSFDSYQSLENAKHTSRAMKENARQGFWNGSKPPFGYQTIEAGHRGDKIKKTLGILPGEAEIVRRIFAMYLGMEGRQFGVKAIASQLNEEGVTLRGKPFQISNVYRILTQESYIGRHWFNVVEAKTRKQRPRSEWVEMQVPKIIEASLFDRAQAQLKARNPRVTPPRVVTGTVLLSGLATCAVCGAGMKLRTGKFNQYRYYTCAGRAQKGATACSGCTVPMDTLDRAVLDHLMERIFRPERLTDLLKGYLDQSQEAERERRKKLGKLRAELTDQEGAYRRLLDAIEKGVIDLDDATVADRFQQNKLIRARLTEEISRAAAMDTAAAPAITPAKLEKLGDAVRERLLSGPPEIRRTYVRLFVSRVVVSRNSVEILGPLSRLARAAEVMPKDPDEAVLAFIPEWRPRRDSNSRPQD